MDRVAIVTGVSRGLGEALAIELLRRGWRVLGMARHDSPRLARPSYRFVAADLADCAALDALLEPVFAELAREHPAAAVLVNNAADAGPVGVFGRLAASDIATSLAVNVAAPAALCNLFCRAFADAACARRILNVSSGAAERTLPGIGIYGVGKAGLEMLTRSIAAEQGAGTLEVVTLRPGIVDTDMQVFARSQSRDVFPSVELFQQFHSSGQLVAAATVARKTIDRLIEGPVESGRTYNYGEL
jgi:benzil reductase ((S)-benzoin forming)